MWTGADVPKERYSSSINTTVKSGISIKTQFELHQTAFSSRPDLPSRQKTSTITMLRQLVLLLLVAVAAINATVVRPCGGSATLNHVEVEGCADSVNGRCEFVKGRSYKVTVDATSNSAATALPYTAKATILGVPITLLSGDACESLTTGQCPAAPGNRFVFEKEVEITNTYPAIQSTLKVEVKDPANALLLCADIRFEIKNA